MYLVFNRSVIFFAALAFVPEKFVIKSFLKLLDPASDCIPADILHVLEDFIEYFDNTTTVGATARRIL